jgi:hypothetical protein
LPEYDELNGSLPLWVKVALRYGVSTVIALFLVYSVTNSLTRDVKDTKEMLQQHIGEQRFYLRAICFNSAKDDAQRASCIPSLSGQ